MKREIKTMNCDQHIVSEDYRAPVMFALLLQIPIAVICFLVLDGGQLAKICGIAMAAHWAGILLVMARRPHAPLMTDIAYIRLGFLLIFLPLFAPWNW
jgi:hypothetical protein